MADARLGRKLGGDAYNCEPLNLSPKSASTPLERGGWPEPVTRTEPYRLAADVTAGASCSLQIDIRGAGAAEPSGAVLAFTFFALDGRPLPGPHQTFSSSQHFGAYRYFPCTPDDVVNTASIEFVAPAGVARVEIAVHAWRRPRLNVYAAPALRVTAPVTPPAARRPSGSVKNTVIAELSFPCAEATAYRIFGKLRLVGPPAEKVGVLTIACLDDDGCETPQPLPGYSSSEVGRFRYLNAAPDADTVAFDAFVQPPAGTRSVRLRILQWSTLTGLQPAEPTAYKACTWREYFSELDLRAAEPAILRHLSEQSAEAGDMEASRAIIGELHRRNPTDQTRTRLNMLQGHAQELRLDWLPRVIPLSGARRRRADVRPSPLHLFKVFHPPESSGGAVRNLNIVRSQARLGMRPLAVLSVQRQPLPEAFGQGDADGVFKWERDGFTVAYARFAAYDRKAVRPDTLLELEATLAARLASAHGCSVVHAASGFKGFDNALKGLAIARSQRLPFVYEVRSFHEHTWSGRLEPWVLEAPLTVMRARQEERCMAEADAIVTIAESMVDELVSRGVPRERIHLVPNSVDDHFLAPGDEAAVAALRSQFGLNDKRVVGYVSNMSAREGHDILIRAFAQIADARPDLMCLLVGDGSERPRLERLALELGVGDRVVFPGSVDHAQIREVYSLIDVFVVPRQSDYASDFVTPLKPFEALAMARPLVMSDRPVAREILGDGERGTYFRTGDAAHLAAAINQILDHPDRARAKAIGGQAWVRTERTWSSNARRYAAIYEAAEVHSRARSKR